MTTLKMLRRGVSVICLGLAISSASLSTAMAEKVITMAAPGNTDFDNLDPRVLTGTQIAVQIAMFEPLVRSNGFELEPGMAESWEISDDGTVYTFHLRDALWSDGKQVTAGDFAHAFVRLFQNSPASSIYDDVLNGARLAAGEVGPEELGVKALDDRTLQITLKTPAPYFLGLISSTLAAPGREDLVDKFGDGYGASAESLASNGPFTLTQWQHENILVMEKNPNYWNANAVHLDKVVFLVLPDEGTKRNMFDNGELSIYEPVTETEAAGYEAQGMLTRYAKGGVRNLQLNRHGFGGTDPDKAKILSNVDFMKAISYALDRQGYIDAVLQGNAIPATVQAPAATYIYPGKNWGDASPNFGKFHPVTADLKKSADLMARALQETGFASVADLPEFTMTTQEDPDNPKGVTPYFYSVLSEIGLKVKIDVVTGKQFWSTLNKPSLGYDFAVAGWGPDFDDPYTYMGYWQTSSHSVGVTFENEQFDQMLHAANSEMDLVRRAELLGAAEALFSDIGPAIPFLHWKGAYAAQPGVSGIITASFGQAINYLYADIEQ